MKKKKSKFFISLSITLAVIFSFIIGTYFLIDKVLVPQYFGRYNINNISELVRVATTMYSVPDEKKFITNPYSKQDELSAQSKLSSINFPTTKSGDIDYTKLVEPNFRVETDVNYKDDYLILTDKELSSIMTGILDSGVLVAQLSDLSNLDTLQMSVREFIITPFNNNSEEIIVDNNKYNTFDSANLSVTVKIDMSSAKSQMAKNIDMPLFLLNILVPKTVYMTTSFDITKNEDGKWEYSNTTLAINGKTAEQSEIVLDMLISFLYSNDDSMTIQKLSDQIAYMSTSCFNVIGEFTFTDNITIGTAKNHGILLLLNKYDSKNNTTSEEEPKEESIVEEIEESID